jgi:predicted nucleotidyltransferase
MAVSTSPPEVLDEIVSRLVDGLGVVRIYLFGSQADGQARPDSDYDLLVVIAGSDLPRHQREAILYDLLWGLTVPVDVIVLTQAEFRQQAQVKTSLAATAKNRGILVYGRSEE